MEASAIFPLTCGTMHKHLLAMNCRGIILFTLTPIPTMVLNFGMLDSIQEKMKHIYLLNYTVSLVVSVLLIVTLGSIYLMRSWKVPLLDAKARADVRHQEIYMVFPSTFYEFLFCVVWNYSGERILYTQQVTEYCLCALENMSGLALNLFNVDCPRNVIEA